MNSKELLKLLLPDFILDLRYLKKASKLEYFRVKNQELTEILNKNRNLKNKYKGERCFILGNGPSINHIDFSALQNEYTFTVNQASRIEGFSKLKTNFHVWQDSRFFQFQSSESGKELIQVMNSISEKDNKPIVFFRCEFKDIIEKYRINKDLDKHYFLLRETKKYNINKYNDYTKVAYDFPTVIHTCVCLAVYMGFTNIYLLGCDCTGIITIAQSRMQAAEKSTYAYKISDYEKKRLELLTSQTSFRDEMLSQVQLIDLYTYLGKYCERYGSHLFNATDGGLLEVLPRVNLYDLL